MEEMTPVKEDRSYIKGNGACVNVNDVAYRTRLKRLEAHKRNSSRVEELENEVEELKLLIKQLINKG